MATNPHPLKKLLEERGILQKDLPQRLAEISKGKVKIGPTAVSNWLNGRNAISVEIRPYLAALFKVPEETFAPPSPAGESRGIGAAVLGEPASPDLPPLELEFFVGQAGLVGPPLYKTRFLLQVESVDGEPVLIVREREGRDPRTLTVEVEGETVEGTVIAARVDATSLGPVDQVVPPVKTDDRAVGATLVLRVPLLAGDIRKWLEPLTKKK